jgi:hypothetical protein
MLSARSRLSSCTLACQIGDQKGRFTIRGLPPGRYAAIAVGYLQPGDEQDPDLLEAWRKDAMRFTLSEGETHEVDLRVSKF